MADFVAVLRKTVGALGENTPEMREKVFEKARATIDAKLKAIQPPPPQPVIDRQRKALEDAIAVVKADYATAEPAKDDTLEDIFASLKSLGEPKPKDAPVSPAVPPIPDVSPAKPAERKPPEVTTGAGAKAPEAPVVAPVTVSAPAPAPVPQAPAIMPEPPRNDVRPAPIPVPMPRATDPLVDDEEPQGPPTDDGVMPVAANTAMVGQETRKRRGGGLIAAAIALLVVAGAGYGIWVNRDDFAAMVGLDSGPAAPEDGAVTTASDLAPPEEETPAAPPAAAEVEVQQPEPEEEIAALPPAAETETAPAASEGSAKFTQRLLADGSEVDEGPAGGPPSVGEGSSVAAATQAGTDQPLSDASPEAGTPAESGQATTTQPPAEQTTTPAAVAVGQKAIFYEERTSSASGSAEVGNIVWSTVEESPGGDLPSEPAIRAEATIPGKDIQLRMTIRRNRDQTLPASHIIEMIFLTPEGFEGGSISNVSRISFKETEQAAGNALIGIPAKIADGFFLIALGDAPAEIETNSTLMRRQSWIDIPITYQSGRRALLSMEKGIPGDKVFQDTLRIWAEADAG